MERVKIMPVGSDERRQMKKMRKDLASTGRVIGGGRAIGKLEPFVPRWELCTPERGGAWAWAWEQYFLPPEGSGPPSPTGHGHSSSWNLETGQVIGSNRDGLTEEHRSQGSVQIPHILKGK